MQSLDLTIIIPAFNEGKGIAASLRELCDCAAIKGAEIIVVDDGSTDNTADVVKGFASVKLVRHTVNRGYGGSIKSGFLASQGKYIAWFDADGQHRLEDLLKMHDFIKQENLDAVLGKRTGDSHRNHSRILGKGILKVLASFSVGKPIPDLNCGLRVFERAILQKYFCLLPNGFSASTTTTLLLIHFNENFKFFPVTAPKRIGKSSVRQIRDGLKVAHIIIRVTMLFNGFRVYALLALLLLSIGLAYSLHVALNVGSGFPVLGALTMIAGMIVFAIGLMCDQITALRLEMIQSNSLKR